MCFSFYLHFTPLLHIQCITVLSLFVIIGFSRLWYIGPLCHIFLKICILMIYFTFLELSLSLICPKFCPLNLFHICFSLRNGSSVTFPCFYNIIVFENIGSIYDDTISTSVNSSPHWICFFLATDKLVLHFILHYYTHWPVVDIHHFLTEWVIWVS